VYTTPISREKERKGKPVPTYTYKCRGCGVTESKFLKMKDHSNIQVCQNCNNEMAQIVDYQVPDVDPVRIGRIRPSQALQERLADIAKNTPNHNMKL